MCADKKYTSLSGQLKSPCRIAAKLAQLSASLINNPGNYGVDSMAAMAVPPSWSDEALARLVKDMRTPSTTIEQDLSRELMVEIEAGVLSPRLYGWVKLSDDGKGITHWAKDIPCSVDVAAIKDEVECSDFVKPCAPDLARKVVSISTVRQGDTVFTYASRTKAIVLYVHTGPVFVSLMVLDENDPEPYVMTRRKGQLIYKEESV